MSGLPRWVVVVLVTGGAVIVALAAVVATLLVTGDDDSTAKEPEVAEVETFTAEGDVTLSDYGGGIINGSDGSCVGHEGYDDMRSGAQVVIKDATGTTLVASALEGGRSETRTKCVFAFEVPDVAGGAGPYSVEVGSRGGIAFEEADADDIHLTLGN